MKSELIPFRIPQIVFVALGLSVALSVGCSRKSQGTVPKPSAATTQSVETTASGNQLGKPDLSTSARPPIQDWGSVVDLKEKIAIFETVFWEPRDTISMRKMIRESDLVQGKKILEIGTGSGLISLCCLAAGADSIVATDVNPAAVANATFNANRLDFGNRLETRWVSLDRPGAYSVIKDNETFDLIFSNPPWEDDQPDTINEFALYDPGFKLIDSMLKDMKQHLKPDGKAYLAYGCVSAIKVIQKLGNKYDLGVKILDERKLDQLDEIFLPGMMLEITPNRSPTKDSGEQNEATSPKSAIWLRPMPAFTIA